MCACVIAHACGVRALGISAPRHRAADHDPCEVVHLCLCHMFVVSMLVFQFLNLPAKKMKLHSQPPWVLPPCAFDVLSTFPKCLDGLSNPVTFAVGPNFCAPTVLWADCLKGNVDTSGAADGFELEFCLECGWPKRNVGERAYISLCFAPAVPQVQWVLVEESIRQTTWLHFCGLKSINSATPQAFKSFKLQIGSTFNFPTCKFRQLRWRNYGSSFAMSRMTAKRAEEGRSTCLPTPRSCLARYPRRAYGGCCRGRNSLTLKPRKHEVMKRAGMRLSGGPAG